MIMRFIAFILFCMAFQSCNTISDPKVFFRGNNVLLPQVSFTSKSDKRFVVEYWPTGDRSSIKKSGESSGTSHDIILLNVTPTTKYNYIIRDLHDQGVSDTYEFVTNEVPKTIMEIKKEKIDSTLFDGYILLRGFVKSGADVLINNKGDIVWYNAYDTAIGRAFFWTGRNSVLSTYDTSRIMEVDLMGKKLLDIDVRKTSPDLNVHHEILYDQAGNIVTITTDCLLAEQHQIKLLQGKPVCGDGIVRLKPDGTVDWKWSILSENKIEIPPGAEPKGKEPLGHANAIDIADDGNYLISMRDFSQVWKINSQTGAVMWKLGKNGDFRMPEESYFLRQHSVHTNSNGEIMVFDNGDKKERPFSRIVSFRLDEEKMEAIPQTIVNLPAALSSMKMCSVYNITDDKFLVCTSRNNVTLAVVDKQGKTLWRVNGNNSSYRAYYIKDPFGVQ
jgi:arylsulfate sulfotransferase